MQWKIHPAHQQEALLAVLDRVGWAQQIVVNQRTGYVVDGHLRVALALRREEQEVPVVYVDLSEDEERLILATLDPITALAVADKEKLAELLDGIAAQPQEIAALLESIAQQYDVQLPADGSKGGGQSADAVCVCPTCGYQHRRFEHGGH